MSWPDEIKEAHRKWERSYYKMRNLENAVTVCNPSEFAPLMDELEAVKDSVRTLALEFRKLFWEWSKHSWVG